MENQFLYKKKEQLIPCSILGIRYTEFEGEIGYRLIIEINGVKLKTNRLKDVVSLNNKNNHPILIEDYKKLKVNDFVYFVNNDAEFIHSINKNCPWIPSMENYFNRIGVIQKVFKTNGIKNYMISFNEQTSFKILETCLYKISEEFKLFTWKTE